MIKYRKIKFENSKIFLKNYGDFLIKYNQFYCASNLLSYGEKQLYLYNHKIIAEKFVEFGAKKYVTEQLKKFIKEWKNAWEKRNINKFKKFYSKSFYNLKNFLIQKNKKFKKYKFIKVKIKNVKIKIVSPIKYKVNFIQEFSSDKYKDIGIKTLIIKNCPGNFKIEKELWKKLK